MEDMYEGFYDYEVDDVKDGEESIPNDNNSPFDEHATLQYVNVKCVEPVVYGILDQLIWLLFACLIFRICTQLVTLPRPLCHLISVVCGISSLFSVIGPNAVYTSILATATYWCLVACAKRAFSVLTYKIVAGSLLTYMVAREYYEIVPEPWEKVRGVQMIIVMKTLSLCYEIWNGVRQDLPPLLDYLGYLFCPGTALFGPWISFQAYSRVFEGRRWGLGWVFKICATSVVSVFCLGFSSCWVYWIFAGAQFSWFVALRDALSVRFNHYFVCFMSEVTTTLCGFYSEEGISIEVTQPMKIELPRSLVEVVVSWNISMHRWLRQHVFRPKQFGPFKSVILTFLVSSMLHGLNFELTMVLLSLGFYTYVEHTLREKLSNIFEACVRSRSCSTSCHHKYKSNHPSVVLVNLLFGFLAYFHLIYLGIMLDKNHSEDNQSSGGLHNFLSNGLKRWTDLGYLSHWVVVVTFIANLAI